MYKMRGTRPGALATRHKQDNGNIEMVLTGGVAGRAVFLIDSQDH